MQEARRCKADERRQGACSQAGRGCDDERSGEGTRDETPVHHQSKQITRGFNASWSSLELEAPSKALIITISFRMHHAQTAKMT